MRMHLDKFKNSPSSCLHYVPRLSQRSSRQPEIDSFLMLEILVLTISLTGCILSWSTTLDVPSKDVPPSGMSAHLRHEALANAIDGQGDSRGSGQNYVLLPSGVYRYEHFSNTKETIILPGGESLDTWVAPHGIAEQFLYYLSGYDYHERPVWIFEWGKWNTKSFVSEGYGKEIQFHIMQAMRRFISSVKYRNSKYPNVTRAVAIVDMKGSYLLELLHVPTAQLYFHVLSEYGNMMLDYVEELIFINAHTVTQTSVAVSRPLVGDILDKFTVFGSTKRFWFAKLRSVLPRYYLPPSYGGYRNFTAVQQYGLRTDK